MSTHEAAGAEATERRDGTADGEREAPSDGVEDAELGTTLHPTLRPTLVWLVTTLVLGIGGVAYVNGNPSLFGDPGTARVARDVLLLLTAILTVRFLARAYVLRRTTYHISPTAVTREYSLLLRSTEREVPFAMVRSHELNQSRIERLLGYGTVSINQGLGGLELENVPSPHGVHDTVRAMVERTE